MNPFSRRSWLKASRQAQAGEAGPMAGLVDVIIFLIIVGSFLALLNRVASTANAGHSL